MVSSLWHMYYSLNVLGMCIFSWFTVNIDVGTYADLLSFLKTLSASALVLPDHRTPAVNNPSPKSFTLVHYTKASISSALHFPFCSGFSAYSNEEDHPIHIAYFLPYFT